MNKQTRGALFDYLPAVATALLAVVTIVLYVTVISEHEGSDYLAVCLITLVPFALIFLNRKFSIGFPRYLIILVCLHFVLAVYAGTALGMYGVFSWWDLFMHGFFGFLCCGILYYLYLRVEKREPKFIHFAVLVLLTIAFAAIWEIYEFLADLILHSDMQCVESALAQGISPLADTMSDILIAVAGAALFCAFLFVARLYARKRRNGQKMP